MSEIGWILLMIFCFFFSPIFSNFYWLLLNIHWLFFHTRRFSFNLYTNFSSIHIFINYCEAKKFPSGRRGVESTENSARNSENKKIKISYRKKQYLSHVNFMIVYHSKHDNSYFTKCLFFVLYIYGYTIRGIFSVLAFTQFT